MSVRLLLQLDRRAYAPGEEVAGTVVVAHGGRSRRLEAFLLSDQLGRDAHARERIAVRRAG